MLCCDSWNHGRNNFIYFNTEQYFWPQRPPIKVGTPQVHPRSVLKPNFMLFWSKTDPFLPDLEFSSQFSCSNFCFKVTQKVTISTFFASNMGQDPPGTLRGHSGAKSRVFWPCLDHFKWKNTLVFAFFHVRKCNFVRFFTFQGHISTFFKLPKHSRSIPSPPGTQKVINLVKERTRFDFSSQISAI